MEKFFEGEFVNSQRIYGKISYDNGYTFEGEFVNCYRKYGIMKTETTMKENIKIQKNVGFSSPRHALKIKLLKHWCFHDDRFANTNYKCDVKKYSDSFF